MSLLTNLYNPVFSLYKHIFIHVLIYTYKHIITYILKSNFIITSLLTNTLLCLSLTCLMLQPKVRLKLDSFAK